MQQKRELQKRRLQKSNCLGKGDDWTMKKSHIKYVKVILNLLTAVVVVLLAALVLPRVLGFFMPFVIGGLISLIANPLVRFFDEKLKIRRKAGSAIVIIAVLAAVILGGYAIIVKLVEEAMGFVKELPDVWQALERDVAQIGQNLSVFYSHLPLDIRNGLADFGEMAGGYISNLINEISSPTVEAVGNFAKNLPSVVIGIIMGLLSAYFFVAEREEVIKYLKTHVPTGIREKWNLVYGSLKGAVGGYFKAQFKIEFWMYILLVIGFSILGIDYALIIALGLAGLDFLPFFGTGAVLIPWAIFEFLTADYKMAIGLLIIWGGGQLARQIIQPKIVGDSIGMPAIPTLFLLYVGYKLAGMIGMIIAVPIGIIIVNMDKGGLFDTAKNSLKILVHGFNNFRRLTREDMEGIHEEKTEEKKN